MPKSQNDLDSLFVGNRKPVPPGYWTDLRAIVNRVLDGEAKPAFPKMQEFLNARHGTDFKASATRSHYERIKRECLDK